MSNPTSNQEKNVSDVVLSRVQSLAQLNALRLPADYSPENALKSAYLMLQDVQTKDKKPVLSACDKTSIQSALFDMVVQGLSPLKRQGYFIAYGDKLKFQRSYFGAVAVAERYAGLSHIRAQVIYEGDEFITEIDPKTGCETLVKHKREMKNIDIKKIRGAYAIFSTKAGVPDMEIMTMPQIRAAWAMGSGEKDAHANFTDQMCKKTLISRACKMLINTSSDAAILPENNETNDAVLDVEYEDVTPDEAPAQEPEKKQDQPKPATEAPKQASAGVKKESAEPQAPELRF